MPDLGEWYGGVIGSLVPTESWSAPNGMFPSEARNDSSVYTFTSSTSTLTLPSSGLADGYLLVAAYEYEDSSNGRHMPQGRIIQASGTGNFVGGPTGGYSRDTSEDRAYVRCWAFVDSPSAAATFQFQYKRDGDSPGTSDGTVRSQFQVIPLYYADVGVYSSTDADLLGGTTPTVISDWTTVLEGTNITRSGDVVTVTGDNKTYLVLGSQFFEGRGGRTQRWHGLDIDGSQEVGAMAYSYYRFYTADDENGDLFTWPFQTSTASVTIEQTCYRGDGVTNGDGGATDDGLTPTSGDHALVVLELNDSAEVFRSGDDTGAQNYATTGPVDIPICRTTALAFNDSAAFTRASDNAVNAEKAMDVLLGANVCAASNDVSAAQRWTAYAEFTKNGTEETRSFAGDYLRNLTTFGWSANLLSFLAVASGDDLGVSVTELSGSEGGGGDIRANADWVTFWGLNLDSLEEASEAYDDGAGSGTLPAVACSATGTYADPEYDDGAGDGSLQPVTGEATGSYAEADYSGAGEASLAPLTGLATGTYAEPEYSDGAGWATLATVVGSGSGAYSEPDYSGGGQGTMVPATGMATGTYSEPEYSDGAGSGALQPVTGEAAGTYAEPQYDDGAGDGTLQPVTGTGEGSYAEDEEVGAGQGTLQPVTGEAAGTYAEPQYDDGAGSGTLAPVTGEAAGSYLEEAVGIGDGTLQPVTGEAAGTYAEADYSGDGDGSLQPVTGEATGTYAEADYSGTGSGTLAPVTGVGAGMYSEPQYDDGAGDGTLQPVTGTGEGSYAEDEEVGAGQGSLQPVTGTGTGTYAEPQYDDGAGDGTLAPVTGEAAGTYSEPQYSGAGDGTLAPVTGVGAGTYAEADYSGIGSGSLQPVTGEAAGTYAEADYSGTGSGSLQPVTGTGTGTYAEPQYDDGSGSGALAPVTGEATGSYAEPQYSDGAGDGTLPVVYGEGTGTYSNPQYSDGAGSGVLAPVTGEAVGDYEDTGGIGSGALQPVTGAGTGSYEAPTYEGTGSGTLQPVTGTGTGSYEAPATGIYGPEWEDAYEAVEESGAEITFTETISTYDSENDQVSITTRTVVGAAMRVRGLPRQYEGLGLLVDSENPTLLFVPGEDNIGSLPGMGSVCRWGGIKFQVSRVTPLNLDGVPILAWVIISGGLGEYEAGTEGKFASEHADAYADVLEAGVAVTFSLVDKTYNFLDDTFTYITAEVEGAAMQVRGDPRKYKELGLVEEHNPTLIFVPATYGETLMTGMKCTWAGATVTVRDINPLEPDSVEIMDRVVVSGLADWDRSATSSKYLQEHAEAYDEVSDAGADATFTEDDTEIVGVAMGVKGDGKMYEDNSLIEADSPTILFVPETPGEIPTAGMRCEWAGDSYSVEAVSPLALDGYPIMARVIVSA